MSQDFKRQPKLSIETHQKIIALDEQGKRPTQIAKELGISPWAVNRHLHARFAYNPKVETERVTLAKPNEGDGEWRIQNGFFWIYFNTRRGRHPENPKPSQIKFFNSPWIIRRFPRRDDWNANYPKVGTFEDITAAEVRGGNYPLLGITDFRSVYVENPPWRNSRNSIAYVRGFLKISGIIQYR